MSEALKDFRRDLHAHPKVSGDEQETQWRIQTFLKSQGLEQFGEVGKFGTLYRFDFGPGPHILVRVDIDALAIQEVNDFPHRSVYDGFSHKCGHDGHTAIGAGLVISLHQFPLNKGKVTVLFQPAEENGEGARGILDDPAFNIDEYDYTVALHNIPGEPMHQMLWKYDGFTPAVQSLTIRLDGRTAHAAQPLTGENPSYAIAEIIAKAKSIEQTDEKHPDYRLITPIYTHIGSQDYGISAGHGEVHLTIRSWTQEDMEFTTAEFLDEVKSIAEAHKLKVTTSFLAVFAANKNHPTVVDAVKRSASALGISTQQKTEPFPWGEDFGLFTQHIPGAMFGLGSGVDTPALHNPDYDYPDEITETGVNLFLGAVKELIG